MNTTDFAQVLGHRVRVRRVDRKMTQIQLASACGADQTQISLLERGQRKRLDLNLVMRIAQALDYPLMALLDEQEEAA